MIKYCPIGQTTESLHELLQETLDTLSHHEVQITFHRNKLKELVTEDVSESIKHAVRNERTAAAKQLDDYLRSTGAQRAGYTAQLAILTHTYNTKLKRKVELEQQIKDREDNPLEYPSVSVESVSETLCTCENVIPDSVTIHQETMSGDVATSLWVSWKLQDIKMTPDVNPYANLNNGKVFTIPLPEITVNINLCHGTIIIHSAHAEGNRRTTFGTHCHPHIMHNQSPCLGDFELAIFQSLESGDIAAFNDLIIMFLSQATNADTAGKTWPQFLPRELLSHICSDRRNTSMYTENDRIDLIQLPAITVSPRGVLSKSRGLQTTHSDGHHVSVETVIRSMTDMQIRAPDWVPKLDDLTPEMDMSHPDNQFFFGR